MQRSKDDKAAAAANAALLSLLQFMLEADSTCATEFSGSALATTFIHQFLPQLGELLLPFLRLQYRSK